ncbi:MAG TPA: amidohydrolase family protein [Thermoanaerobaculia bacterium]|nr:amidohydrolase family protein [Thermoanaerobaculia bacterium]
MTRRSLPLVLLFLLSGLTGCAPAGRGAAPPQSPGSDESWISFFEEAEIGRLILDLSARDRPGRVAFVGVTVLDVVSGELSPGRTVLVSEGRIEAVTPEGEALVPRGTTRIEGRGHTLIPGLVDMHVHSTVTDADTLLQLANGVTSVRDLCGFPWALRVRERIAAGRLLMPNRTVAGHILNAEPLGIHATVVTTPEEARRAVREQKGAGYDFIKVHNILPKEVYRAILDEAARLGIRVVGHVPRGITTAEAIEGGHLTLEHFKDSLPYGALSREGAVWSCPTLYTYRMALKGEEATRLIETAGEMRYVPAWRRRRWLEAAQTEPGEERFFNLSTKIRDPLQIRARLLAGTDSGGGYPNMVPGFALHEELELLEKNGLSPLDVLRAATINAARALEQEDELGTLAPGKRADLVLLAADPLASLANLRHPAGVMVRGLWLDRKALDEMLGRLEEIYRRSAADKTLANPSAAQIGRLIDRMENLTRDGWVFKDHQLEKLAGRLRDRGLEEDARRVLALRGQPTPGPRGSPRAPSGSASPAAVPGRPGPPA